MLKEKLFKSCFQLYSTQIGIFLESLKCSKKIVILKVKYPELPRTLIPWCYKILVYKKYQWLKSTIKKFENVWDKQ